MRLYETSVEVEGGAPGEFTVEQMMIDLDRVESVVRIPESGDHHEVCVVGTIGGDELRVYENYDSFASAWAERPIEVGAPLGPPIGMN